MPEKELPEPGEFTRAFKLQYSGLHTGKGGDKKPIEPPGVSGLFQAAPSPSPASQPPASAVPVDAATQTDLHVPPPQTLSGPAGSPAASPVPPTRSEPGEFTQFFKGGLPGKSTPGGAGGGQRSTYGVQRPNTPITPRNPVADNGFDNFNAPSGRPDAPAHRPEADQYGMNRPKMGGAPDLSKQPAAEEGRAFDFKNLPSPSKKDTPGEYTALFGKAPIPPAPRQSAIAPPPVAPMIADSHDSLQGAVRDVPPPADPAPRGPSEFTIMSKGRPQATEAGGDATPEPAPAGAKADAKKLPVNINVTPINPLAALPHIGGGMQVPGASAHASLHGANVNTALGSASIQGPHMPHLQPLNVSAAAGAAPKGMSDNTKLILFFGVLAILAVILIVVVVAAQKP
jgi:hypothetical protein